MSDVIRGQAPRSSEPVPEPADKQTKLKALKTSIKNHTTDFNVQNYHSNENFKELLIEELTQTIDTLYPVEETPSSLEESRLSHILFANSRTKLYIKEAGYYKQIDAFLNDTDPKANKLLIKAESGMGKSALIANYIKDFSNIDDGTAGTGSDGKNTSSACPHHSHDLPSNETYVLEHYIGAAGHNSSDVYSMLIRLMQELKEEFELDDNIPTERDKIIQEFRLFLLNAAIKRKYKKIVLFIDAIDQLNRLSSKKLNFIPDELQNLSNEHTTIKLILSTNTELEKEGFQTLELKKFDKSYKEKLIKEYLTTHKKSLEPHIQTLLVDSKLSDNPIALKTILDELIVTAHFENLEDLSRNYLNSKDVKELFEKLLMRWEKDYDKDDKGIVKDVLSLFYTSRDGLSLENIVDIDSFTGTGSEGRGACPPHQPSINLLNLTTLYYAMEDHFLIKNGNINFFHRYIQEAVEKRYILADENYANDIRKELADYFLENPDNVLIQQMARELPFHLHKLANKEALIKAISDVDIFLFLQSEWETEVELMLYATYCGADDFAELLFNNSQKRLEELESRETSDEKEKKRNLEDLANTANEIGLFLKAYGKLDKALVFYEKSLNLIKELFGDRHPGTAISYNNLAELYRAVGDYERAKLLHEKSLNLRKELFGDKHPDIASSYNNLAGLYRAVGDFENAKPLLQKSLNLRKELFGDRHPDTATSYNNLALLHEEVGDYERAKPLYEKSLNLTKELFGDKHPNTVATYNNLAELYSSISDFESAKPLHEKSLNLTKELFGDKHADTAISYNNLAGFYRRAGDFEQAEPNYQKAIAILEELFLKGHPNIATAYFNLSKLYKEQKAFQKALDSFIKTLELHQKLYGEKDYRTNNCYYEIADIFMQVGQYQDAVPWYEKYTNITTELYQETDPMKLAYAYYYLGKPHYRLKEYDTALNYLQKAYDIASKKESQSTHVSHGSEKFIEQIRQGIEAVEKAMNS